MKFIWPLQKHKRHSQKQSFTVDDYKTHTETSLMARMCKLASHNPPMYTRHQIKITNTCWEGSHPCIFVQLITHYDCR